MAKPIAAPTMADSQSGVLRTLSFPNSSTKPSVILNAPPYSATSCPMIIKFECLRMACFMASEIASKNLLFVLLSVVATICSAAGAYMSCNSVSEDMVTDGSLNA